MKKKLVSKIGAAVLAASMMMSMAVPAMAAGENYSPVAGHAANATGAFSFEKYLVMDAGAEVPNVTFSYSIAAGTAIPAGNGTMEVLAGLTPGNVTINDTTFAKNDTTYTSVQTGDIDVDRLASDRAASGTSANGVQFDYADVAASGDDCARSALGEKYAVKTATVDFSGVSFPEPGIYRYIISEDASAANAAAGIMHDTDSDRVLDVYVTDDGNGTLVVSSYVLHTDVGTVAASASMGSADVQAAGDALADKTDGFTNEFKTVDLTISKDVSGNQASRDKYFALTLDLAGLNASGQYVVSLADDNNGNTTDGNADATSLTNSATIAANGGQTNTQLITASDAGEAQATFYLQHGQKVAVRGIPLNATYKVVENEEDYLPSFTIDSTDGTVTGNAGAKGMETAQNFNGADHIVAFTNTRNGVIPTGVMMAVAPFAIAAAIGGAGIATVSLKKKKREDEE